MNKLMVFVLLVTVVLFSGCEKKHGVTFDKKGVTWQ